jgi:hypothetical protein
MTEYAEAGYPQATQALMEAHEHRKAIAREYAWVALQDIQINGVNAFHTGSLVPTDHVNRFGFEEDGLVAPVGSPEARQAQGLQPEIDRPARSASKAEWTEYAKANGYNDETLATMGRDEISALFPQEG